MSRPTVSFSKRQREQVKREKQAEKAAKRAQRKIEKTNGPGDEILVEGSEDGIDEPIGENIDAAAVPATAE